jgi:hypothetical protein
MLPECEAAAESAGVVPALVQLLNNAPAGVKEAAAKALSNLAGTKTLKTAVASSTCVAPLVLLLQ